MLHRVAPCDSCRQTKIKDEKLVGTKPKWACAACEMYSSRESSVKRHIQNIHSGNANFVSFVDYLVGRNMGSLLANAAADISEEERCQEDDYGNIMKEEVWRQCIRKEWETP